MFISKHLKMLQHVSIIIQIIFRELVCSMLKLLILKFVKNVKSQCGNAQHNIWCACMRPVWRGMLDSKMFILKHLKMLQHVLIIIQIIFRELVCTF